LRRVPFWVLPSSMRCFIGFLRIIGELPPSREAVPGLPIRQQDGRQSTEFRSCNESVAARHASHAEQATEGERWRTKGAARLSCQLLSVALSVMEAQNALFIGLGR
jgi:hypothetical protein